MKKARLILFGSAMFLTAISAAHAERINLPNGSCVLPTERSGFGGKVYDADSCTSKGGTWYPSNPDGGSPLPPIRPDNNKAPITPTAGNSGGATPAKPNTRPVTLPATKVDPEILKKCRAKPDLPGC